jgi:predicted transcriptional regulator
MEILAVVIGWALLAFFAAGVAQASGKWESEDYPFSKPSAKLVRKVDGKTSPAAQTTNTSEAVVKSSEKNLASSHNLTEIRYVHRVMQRQPRYCFEYQSVDEVRKIMRERDVSFLVVLDHNMRMVGVVTIEDLARHEKQDPPEPDASQGGK